MNYIIREMGESEYAVCLLFYAIFFLRNLLYLIKKTIPLILYQRYRLDMELHHKNDTRIICGR